MGLAARLRGAGALVMIKGAGVGYSISSEGLEERVSKFRSRRSLAVHCAIAGPGVPPQFAFGERDD